VGVGLLGGALLSGCGGSGADAGTAASSFLAKITVAAAADCGASEWVSGKSYVAGDIVVYSGNYYKALYANPGYIPTVSTYYWAEFARTWAGGTNYPVGTVVEYPANGYFYKEVNAAAGSTGSDGTDPTVSTYLWNRYTCATTPPPASTKIAGGYYPNWLPGAIRVRDVPTNYNLIYLFSAHPVGGSPGTTGAVTFDLPGDDRGAATNFYADVQYVRGVQKRKVILSIGGAGNSMTFPDRAHSQNFVDSVVALYNQFGGFDGIDWDNFEGIVPSTSEMIWISQELKRRYPGFLVTSPPAPWNNDDLAFCQAMVQAAALDYCGPQYYDGPGLADPAYVADNIDKWVAALGASHVVVGLGINNATNYMTPSQAVDAWNRVKTKYPAIRGGFDWAISTDEAQGWPFATTVAPLITQ
jgi:chitinase